MLIRSQDNKTLFNFTQCINIGEHGKGAVIYVNNLYPAGEYSTAEKALKVLDMIQEAYADAALIPMAVPNIGKMFTEAPASKANELLAEAIGEVLMNKMVFQMPEDGSVEV
nr:MAG TPA: hypothetical protein [Caudoviricetes sp.]